MDHIGGGQIEDTMKTTKKERTYRLTNRQRRLRALKEKLKVQRQHLDDLDAHMYVVPRNGCQLLPVSFPCHQDTTC